MTNQSNLAQAVITQVVHERNQLETGQVVLDSQHAGGAWLGRIVDPVAGTVLWHLVARPAHDARQFEVDLLPVDAE